MRVQKLGFRAKLGFWTQIDVKLKDIQFFDWRIVVPAMSNNEEESKNVQEVEAIEENEMATNFDRLISSDPSRIGWPEPLPALEKVKHGWFRPGNQEILQRILRRENYISNGKSRITNFPHKIHCIIELGTWLGISTEFILKQCPKAIVLAVDLWENEYFYNDSHYNKNDEQFSKILQNKSIYHQCLNNLIDYKYTTPTESESSNQKNSDNNEKNKKEFRLIPLRMDSVQALRIIASHNIKPEVIYIDASHHYDFVVNDITTCTELFPDAILVGDDWDNPDVRQAVKDMAKRLNKEIYVRGGTCWTFAKDVMDEIEFVEQEREEEEQQKRKKLKTMHTGKFSDALKLMKERK